MLQKDEAPEGALHYAELLAQAAAVFDAQGLDMGEEVLRYLLPVLEGKQDLARNREMLEAIIAQLEASHD